MASITLHRASRILDSIAKAQKVDEPKPSVKLSIFSPNLQAEVERIEADTNRAVERIGMLNDCKAVIRAAVGIANAETGISTLLARKAAIEANIASLESLPGVSTAKAEPEDEMAMYRRRRAKPAPMAVIVPETVLATATAMRGRFEGAVGETGASEIEVGTVTAAGAAAYRKQVVAYRRELDAIADRLRAANASTLIEVSDVHMDWLTTHDVV